MADIRISTSWGEFIGPEEDIIVSTLKANTLWDGQGFLQPLAKEWARFGELGTTVLDVGAHFGYFTCWLAAQGAWRVVSVEPMPETFRYLQMNLDLNKAVCADRVIPLKVAAYGARQQVSAGLLDPGNWGGRCVTQDDLGTIPGVPLDHYQFLFGQRVSLVKIDAQGCDGQIILGLAQTLKRDRPVVIFEWDEHLAPRHGITLYEVLTGQGLEDYSVYPWPTHPDNYIALPRSRPCNSSPTPSISPSGTTPPPRSSRPWATPSAMPCSTTGRWTTPSRCAWSGWPPTPRR